MNRVQLPIQVIIPIKLIDSTEVVKTKRFKLVGLSV